MEYTKQSIFNAVWDWFIVQGHPRCTESDNSLRCLYRRSDGNRCAFGVILPDELYRPEFETKDCSFILEKLEKDGGVAKEWVDNLKQIGDDYERFLVGLQQHHDNPYGKVVR